MVGAQFYWTLFGYSDYSLGTCSSKDGASAAETVHVSFIVWATPRNTVQQQRACQHGHVVYAEVEKVGQFATAVTQGPRRPSSDLYLQALAETRLVGHKRLIGRLAGIRLIGHLTEITMVALGNRLLVIFLEMR